MSSKAGLIFRVTAVAEALSWVGLLVGMFFKYVVQAGEGGVPVLGMVHGVVTIIYVAVTLTVFRPLRWRFGTVLLALVALIPPLFTWWFEKWALRTGRLDSPQVQEHGGTGLFATPAAEPAN